MSSQRSELHPIFTINARDRLIDVNEAYVEAVAAEMGVTTVDDCLGRSVWDFVPAGAPKLLWQVLYRRVRAIVAPVFLPMRIDSASERRLADVELHALGNDYIRHVLRWMSRETRPAVALLDRNFPRDHRTLARCVWCARIQVRLGSWLEVEETQQALRLEVAATLPKLEDDACTACKQVVLKAFPARAA